MDEHEHKIYIGTAGWSYPDWEGIVYPKPKPRNFDPLEFLAKFFKTIEINNTFYRPPSSKSSQSWVRRVEGNPEFKFTAKLHKKFTHERKDITPADEKQFKAGIDPLLDSGKLGCILVQFPWSFKFTPENSQYFKRLLPLFRDYPLVIEVRHSSWDNELVYEQLRQEDIGFCNIDQPRLRSQLKPGQETTSDVGYVRLHGQNLENWFREDADRDERYNYLYSTKELEPWVERILAISRQAKETYVIANNHFQGKAATNALQLISLLGEEKVDVPDSLQRAYPQLSEIATEKPGPEQGTLF
jgi:uncharacterized protein YecE (DUF72 family)